MSSVNNPISLLAGDPSPLTANPNTISSLSSNTYTTEFLKGELVRVVGGEGAIQCRDVQRNTEFLYTCRFVDTANSGPLQQPFGFTAQHARTLEHIDGSFTLIMLYKVNASDGHTPAFPGKADSTNSIIDVERRINASIPLVGGFRVDKRLRTEMAAAMNSLAESNKPADVREALGMPRKNDADNPLLVLSRDRLKKFLSNIKINVAASANAQIRGDNNRLLMTMGAHSASIYTCPHYKPLRNTQDRRELALKLNACVTDMLFGLNKAIPIARNERSSVEAVLYDALNVFSLNTDNDASLPEMHGELSGPGAPFSQPNVIIMCSNRLLGKLAQMGLVKTSEVDAKQYVASLRLKQSDMSPLVALAPQDSVHLINGQYVRDPNTSGIARESRETKKMPLKWAKIGDWNIMFVDVDNGSFCKTVREDTGLTTMSTYDSMVPTGVTMSSEGGVPRGPSRQVTTFCNENGVNHTLTCEMIAPFLTKFFGTDTQATFDLSTVERDDRRGIVERLEKSLIFYRSRDINDDDLEDECGDEEESERRKADLEKLLYRNTYMTDNKYYTDNEQSRNIISVLKNMTSPDLRELTHQVNEEYKTLSKEKTDGPYDENNDNDIYKVKKKGRGIDEEEEEEEEEGVDEDDDESFTVKMCERRVNIFHGELVVASVMDYMATKLKIQVDPKKVRAVHRVLLRLTNKKAVEYLKYINMGFGVLWLLPQFLQADSLLITRPGCMFHARGAPSMNRVKDMSDESQYEVYSTESYSPMGRLSLATNPGVFWRNAALIDTQAAATGRAIKVTDQAKMRSAMNWLEAMRRSGVADKTIINPEHANAWWPVFIQPVVTNSFFESANSPVGRLNTHYASREEFEDRFSDPKINDIKYPTVFSVNEVFSDPMNNINTLFLYNRQMIESEDGCPLSKYLNFNQTAASAVTNMEGTYARAVNTIMNMNRQDNERIEPMGLDHSNVSHAMGAAFPRYCYNNGDLAGEVLVRKDYAEAGSYRTNKVITSGDTSFLITGTNAQQKFERCGVSHSSFVL